MAMLAGLLDFIDCEGLSISSFFVFVSAKGFIPALFGSSILPSAFDCFNMEDTEGELGTFVVVVVHASGALSLLSEYLFLLFNLLDIFDSNVLLSLSSFFTGPVFNVDLDIALDDIPSIEVVDGFLI